MGKLRNIPDDVFEKAVKDSGCIQEVIEKLGYSQTSVAIGKLIKKRIIEMGIDTSHFDTPYARFSNPIYELDGILTEDYPYCDTTRLEKGLLKAGLLKYECSECGNKGEWNGKPLKLQLEHKNGECNDNKIDNLCFLCPNCRSQTDHI